MIILLILAVLLPILLLLVLPASLYRTLGSWSQTLMWGVGLLLTSPVALWSYLRIHTILGPPLPLPTYLFWALKILAIASPTCIAVALLRSTGLPWRQSLLLFPLVPVGMLAISLWIAFPFAS